MGCHGALNGIRVADAIAARDPGCCVLLCAVELCSLHYQYGWSAPQIVSNSLFADGAAAIVGRPGINPVCDRPRVLATGSYRIPHTAELMSWRIGDHGFEMCISPQVPAAIQSALRPWIEQWLRRHGVELSAIDAWAIHPGGPRILDACVDALGLSPPDLQTSRKILRRYGNMSSPTVLFVFEQIRKSGTAGLCVLLAFGPGLRVEAVLIKLSD
jgi:predicted naringenin-chalcone synthase